MGSQPVAWLRSRARPSKWPASELSPEHADPRVCDFSLGLARKPGRTWAIPKTEIRLRLACIWPLSAIDTLQALRTAGSPLSASGPPIKIARSQVYSLLWESTGAALCVTFSDGHRIDHVFLQHANRMA